MSRTRQPRPALLDSTSSGGGNGTRAASRLSIAGRPAAWSEAIAPLRPADLALYGLVVVFCFFSFQHPDLHHTIGCSLAYLEPHVRTFYDYNKAWYGAANYLPSTYVVYALWGLPLKVLGLLPAPGASMVGVQFWYKLLNGLFFAGSAGVLRSIGLRLGLGRLQANVLTATYAASPIACFSVFIFGQYDIITTFFFLCAVHAYVHERPWRFTAWTAVAVTFKYYAFFLYVPLLLLRQKDLRKVALHGAASLSLLALEVALYWPSPTFQEGVFGFHVNQRVFSAAVSLGHASVSLFFCVWFFICAVAAFKHVATGEEERVWGAYLALAACCAFFGLSFWHPQWLLFLTPFLALGAAMHLRRDQFAALDVMMMLAMTMFTVSFWQGGVDQSLWASGVFGSANPGLADSNRVVSMANLLPGTAHREMWLALFAACLLAYVVQTLPKPSGQSWIRDTGSATDRYPAALRLRFIAGLGLWLVPATWAYVASMR
jgi:hypothetical protein